MRQLQQPDHDATGDARGMSSTQRVPGLAVGVARKQLVSIDQVEQRTRLATQGVDDMVVVDDVHGAIGLTLDRPPAWQD